jgi:hypothetical protein
MRWNGRWAGIEGLEWRVAARCSYPLGLGLRFSVIFELQTPRSFQDSPLLDAVSEQSELVVRELVRFASRCDPSRSRRHPQ